MTDPALSSQNLAAAAAEHGAKFTLGVEVTEILQEAGKVIGVRLGDGSSLLAPIVVNVAGPGSAPYQPAGRRDRRDDHYNLRLATGGCACSSP